jgi:hypothetical protein
MAFANEAIDKSMTLPIVEIGARSPDRAQRSDVLPKPSGGPRKGYHGVFTKSIALTMGE